MSGKDEGGGRRGEGTGDKVVVSGGGGVWAVAID